MQKRLNRPLYAGPIAVANAKTVCASVNEDVAKTWDATTTPTIGHSS